jgi:ecotin
MTKGILLLAAVAAFLSPGAGAAGMDDGMKPYPPPEEGVRRLVFQVPPLENEDDRKVEIMIGRTMEVDCNRVVMGGDLEQRTARGWGFPYYVLEAPGPAASTRMACPPGTEKRQAFVQVQGEGFLRRYNSKLPMVVYLPDGFEVRYRVWSAGPEVGEAIPQ